MYHWTVDLLFEWFGISCMTTDNFCFYLQNRLIQTSQTSQWYNDTSPPLVFPGYVKFPMMWSVLHCRNIFSGEAVCRVGDEHAGLADCAIADHDALDRSSWRQRYKNLILVTRKLMGSNLKGIWAKFSTLSLTFLLMIETAWRRNTHTHTHLELKI
jgi:hypothetical protein